MHTSAMATEQTIVQPQSTAAKVGDCSLQLDCYLLCLCLDIPSCSSGLQPVCKAAGTPAGCVITDSHVQGSWCIKEDNDF